MVKNINKKPSNNQPSKPKMDFEAIYRSRTQKSSLVDYDNSVNDGKGQELLLEKVGTRDVVSELFTKQSLNHYGSETKSDKPALSKFDEYLQQQAAKKEEEANASIVASSSLGAKLLQQESNKQKTVEQKIDVNSSSYKKETTVENKVVIDEKAKRKEEKELARKLKVEQKQKAKLQKQEAKAAKLEARKVTVKEEELTSQKVIATESTSEINNVVSKEELRKQKELEKQLLLEQKQEAKRIALQEKETAKQQALQEQQEAKRIALEAKEAAKQQTLHSKQETNQQHNSNGTKSNNEITIETKQTHESKLSRADKKLLKKQYKAELKLLRIQNKELDKSIAEKEVIRNEGNPRIIQNESKHIEFLEKYEDILNWKEKHLSLKFKRQQEELEDKHEKTQKALAKKFENDEAELLRNGDLLIKKTRKDMSDLEQKFIKERHDLLNEFKKTENGWINRNLTLQKEIETRAYADHKELIKKYEAKEKELIESEKAAIKHKLDHEAMLTASFNKEKASLLKRLDNEKEGYLSNEKASKAAFEKEKNSLLNKFNDEREELLLEQKNLKAAFEKEKARLAKGYEQDINKYNANEVALKASVEKEKARLTKKFNEEQKRFITNEESMKLSYEKERKLLVKRFEEDQKQILSNRESLLNRNEELLKKLRKQKANEDYKLEIEKSLIKTEYEKKQAKHFDYISKYEDILEWKEKNLSLKFKEEQHRLELKFENDRKILIKRFEKEETEMLKNGEELIKEHRKELFALQKKLDGERIVLLNEFKKTETSWFERNQQQQREIEERSQQQQREIEARALSEQRHLISKQDMLAREKDELANRLKDQIENEDYRVDAKRKKLRKEFEKLSKKQQREIEARALLEQKKLISTQDVLAKEKEELELRLKEQIENEDYRVDIRRRELRKEFEKQQNEREKYMSKLEKNLQKKELKLKRKNDEKIAILADKYEREKNALLAENLNIKEQFLHNKKEQNDVISDYAKQAKLNEKKLMEQNELKFVALADKFDAEKQAIINEFKKELLDRENKSKKEQEKLLKKLNKTESKMPNSDIKQSPEEIIEAHKKGQKKKRIIFWSIMAALVAAISYGTYYFASRTETQNIDPMSIFIFAEIVIFSIAIIWLVAFAYFNHIKWSRKAVESYYEHKRFEKHVEKESKYWNSEIPFVKEQMIMTEVETLLRTYMWNLENEIPTLYKDIERAKFAKIRLANKKNLYKIEEEKQKQLAKLEVELKKTKVIEAKSKVNKKK